MALIRMKNDNSVRFVSKTASESTTDITTPKENETKRKYISIV